MPPSTPQSGETILLMEHLEETPLNSNQIREWTKRDPVMSKVFRFTMQGWPESYDSTTFKSYHSKKFELSVEDGCLLWAAEPLHPWEWPGHPWTRLHIDYAGPFKGEMFLVVVDAYSKWLEVHQMTSNTSTATIEKLREIFATHGLPTTVVSENGTNFTSSEFEEFMKRNDGGRKFENKTIAIPSEIPHYTPYDNGCAASGAVDGQTPAYSDLIQPNLGDRVREKQSQQKAVHDYHARERIIKTGNLVYAKDFRKPERWMPGTVVKKTGLVSAEIQLDDGLIIRRYQDHLRIRTDVPQTTVANGLENIQLPTREVNPAEPREEPELEGRAEQRRQPHRDRRLPQHLQDYELANS
ncbi:PREDICTED: uncharacterized protein K02A2.6-like [Paramuricea clavata]|uniref:PREDICTED: uncharacterized protein K02A2.6-like n=1 Tax=Paramuricea clavata TaxID=317549 RepID=A0A7D9HG13_PARCT|nr:PREDICTED: uncharacterized protein K02A2.6-like [Paramuricea clavata]